MNAPASPSDGTPRLKCCGGQPAPKPVADGWTNFLRLPSGARERFWELLAPALLDPANPQNQELLGSYSEEHGLEQRDVLLALQAVLFLLRRSSSLNLNRDDFAKDLTALNAESTTIGAEIIAKYDLARQDLRREILDGTLADHGKTLVGLDWRIDTIQASDRGSRIDSTVVMLTLRYQDGDGMDRITLQLTPQSLGELKAFVDRFGGQV